MAGRARREWGTGSCFAVKGGRYWRVSVPVPSAGGRKRQEWQYRTEAAARRQLEAVQRRLDRGLPAEEGRLTVAEYAVEWLAQLQVKSSTKAMYDSLVRNQLGHVGSMRLTRVSPPDIRALLDERTREGYAGRTRRGILDVLRMIFRLAEHDGLVTRNPAETVTAPRIDAKEPVHLTAEQARRFLEAAKDDHLFALYAVALGTGLRRGEVLGLTWRDADLVAGTVTVRKGKTAAAARSVPLPAFARDALAGLQRRPGQIFAYSPGYVTRHLGALCERLGLPRIGPHGLRHTYATLLRESGVSLETRRDLMGHSKTEMTMFYSHGKAAQQRAAVDDLERMVG